MQKIFEIATNISTPLMLAGFVTAALFLILRQLLQMNIFSVLTRQFSADIIRLIIKLLFVLVLVAMVFGFAGFVLTVVPQLQTHTPEPPPPGPTLQPLAGVIWDDNHETVADVEVFLPEFSVTTFTDRQGKFSLQVQATRQRQVRLIARKEGYEARVEEPTIGNTSLSFVLRRKP